MTLGFQLQSLDNHKNPLLYGSIISKDVIKSIISINTIVKRKKFKRKIIAHWSSGLSPKMSQENRACSFTWGWNWALIRWLDLDLGERKRQRDNKVRHNWLWDHNPDHLFLLFISFMVHSSSWQEHVRPDSLNYWSSLNPEKQINETDKQ